jgi:GNAT superfamily N-acetyltransferase
MWRVMSIAELGRGGGAYVTQVEAIFFGSAAKQSFVSDDERAAFRDLWLGRYLTLCPAAFLLALNADGAVAGYLAGASFSNREPLPGPDYYAQFPAPLIAAYPAHLHVNVRQDHRGQGVGATLIDAFRVLCRSHSLAGFHAVTTARSPAAAFFTRCDLHERATADWRGRPLAFLAAPLD